MAEDDIRSLYAEIKQLGVKIDNLADLFNHAAHGDGFTRCAGHAGRLDHVEAAVARCHGRLDGMKRWLAAGLVSLVSLLANIIWNMTQDSLRK